MNAMSHNVKVYSSKLKILFKTCFFLVCSLLLSPYANAEGLTLSPKSIKKLQSITVLENDLTGTYYATFTINDAPYPINQALTLSNCKMSLITNGKFAGLFQDNFDLSDKYPHRSFINHYGTYGISLGFFSQLWARTNLYFNSRDERYPILKKLDELSSLCHTSEIEEFFTALEPTEHTEISDHNGRIPIFTKPLAPKIHTEEEYTYMAQLSGELSFAERVRSIQKATTSIAVQTIFFRADESGIYLANALMERRQDGLNISLIIDGLSSLDKGQGPNVEKNTFILYNNLMASGIRVHGYSCLGKFIRNEFRGLDLSKLVSRRHEKSWIVDGELAEYYAEGKHAANTTLAIIGGVNISQEYFRLDRPGKNRWKDQDLIVRGPIVKDVYNAYMRNAEALAISYKSYSYDKYCFNNFDPLTQPKEYQEFKENHTQEYKELNEEEQATANIVKEKVKRFATGYIGKVDSQGNEIVSKPKYYKIRKSSFFNDRPDELEKYTLSTVLDLINNAKDEVLISNAYFVPILELRQALNNAANRGVKIKVITNHPAENDLKIVSILGRYFYSDLVEGNLGMTNAPSTPRTERGPEEIKFYEWIGKMNNEVNSQTVNSSNLKNAYYDFEIKDDTISENKEDIFVTSNDELKDKITEGTLHAKYMIVDRKVGLIGSFNLNNLSPHNYESSVVFESQHLSNEFVKIFLNTLDYTSEITPDQIKAYHNPPFGKYRFLLSFSKLVKRFM